MARLTPEQQEEKFMQCVLFFLNEMGPLDEKHLTYLMYYLDFDHMEQHGHSVTGGRYYKGVDEDGEPRLYWRIIE
jgi:hypothetical protein